MNAGRLEMRHLLIPAALALLLAGAGSVAGAREDGAAAVSAPQEKLDAERGCCGCRGRSAAAEEAPGCRKGGAGGCCRMGRQARRGPGHGMRRGPGRAGGGHGGPPAIMQTARALVHDHRDALERQVEMLDNGVVTVTRAPADAEAAEAIRRHVREMKQVLETGGRVRMWDPLFRELFDHAEEIVMEVEELDDGMRVTETSEDPRVAKLIQAHARKVTEFIERGPAAVHEETPLPEGYAAGE